MDILCDDVLIETLKFVITKDLINFSLTSKKYNTFFKKKIKHFEINCSETKITDAGLQYLKGAHTIDLSSCRYITDQGLQYLIGVHTINLYGCCVFDNKWFQYLEGVHTIHLNDCGDGITEEGLQYIKGIHTMYLCGYHSRIFLKGLECLKSTKIIGYGFN